MASIDTLAAPARTLARSVIPAAPDAGPSALRPLFPDAAEALADLPPGSLAPTGRVAEALAAGRLLRTSDDARLDRLERILREGAIDPTDRRPVGEGVNGLLHRVRIADPVDPASAPTWAVEKPAGAQAAQEELGWRLARALGIDHLVPAVARRADGAARIEFREGRGLTQSGILDVDRLEQALARHYLDDAALALTSAEAAQAARIDRQLLQAFDYLLANNDRRAANGLYDAARGVSFIDAGHAGRGTLAQNGGTTLEPALQLFQAGREGGRVQLDGVVVEYIRRRLDADRLRSLHRTVFDAPGIAGPEPRSLGERFIGHVRSDAYRDGMVQRLANVLDTGGYRHNGYRGDAGGELPPLMSERLQHVRGFGAIRAAMHAPF